MKNRYRIGFAMYSGKGFATHNMNLYKYAQRDPEIDMVWATIGAGELPKKYQPFPRFVGTQLALLDEAAPLLQQWDELDAIVVEDAPRLFALMTLRRMVFDHHRRQPLLILYQDYAPLRDTNLLGWYGYHTSRTSFPGRLSYAAQCWVAQHADRCILFSNWAREIMVQECGVADHRAFVVKPGSDLELWHYQPRARTTHNRPHILFVGGDFQRKGGDLLLTIFREQFAHQAELDLVTRQIDTDDLPPSVHLYTDINANDPRLRQLYAQADLFVLPTRADFSSLAAIEAMAVGLPVIISRVGGTTEIVRDGETGFLITSDDAEGLRSSLGHLLADAALRQRMGAAGRATVEQEFNIAANVTELLTLIKEACDVGAMA